MSDVEWKKKSIENLMKLAGCSVVQRSGRNVQVSCLLAPYTGVHKNAVDSKPSMGILPREDDTCLLNCFTCGWKSRSLEYLFISLAEKDPRFLPFIEEARKIEEVDLDAALDGCVFQTWAKDNALPPYPIFPEEKLLPYSGKFHPYLERRGLLKPSAKLWEVGYDQSAARATFPVRDFSGSLVGMVGRSVQHGGFPKYMNYWEFDKGKFLYGENKCVRGRKTVLVEGILDTVITWQQLGGVSSEYNVLGGMGADLTREQVDKIIDNSLEVILLFDGDKAGDHATDRFCDSVGRRTLIRKTVYPPEAPRDQEGKTDPAMSKDFIKQMVETSEIFFD
jgi:hypothetical protein